MAYQSNHIDNDLIRKFVREIVNSKLMSRTSDRPDYLDLPSSGEPWEAIHHEFESNQPKSYGFDYDHEDEPTGDKELILLSCQINLGTMSAAKSRQMLTEHAHQIQAVLDDVNKKTKYYAKAIFTGVTGQDTKIECIFPVGVANPISMELIDKLAVELNKDTFRL